jgi:hypothetical protein
VILSRGRSETIQTHKIMPYAVLCIPEGEKEDYKYIDIEKCYVPDNIKGLGPLRNWILNKFDDEIIVMADDDIVSLDILCVIRSYSIYDPEKIRQIIYSTAMCAKDIGTSCFGFNQCWDVRKYRAYEPFLITGWVGGVIGVIGRRIKFVDNWFKTDIDFCLRTLLKDRIIWKDNRYSFVQGRDRNKGGNSTFRTIEKVERELEYLENMWGKHFIRSLSATGETIKLNVPRKER